MPKNQGPCVCGQVSLVRRQHRSEEAQVLEFAQFQEWGVKVADYWDGECWLVAEQPEEDDVVISDEVAKLFASQQDSPGRVPTNQATIPPDRHKTRLALRERFGQPIGVLAPLATAIDECARKNIMVFHARGVYRKSH
jgi:hypothetical protein